MKAAELHMMAANSHRAYAELMKRDQPRTRMSDAELHKQTEHQVHQAEQHEAYARDHQTLSGSTVVPGAGQVSSQPMVYGAFGRAHGTYGDKSTVEYAKGMIAEHTQAAIGSLKMAEAHKAESTKESPAMSDAEWDEQKHPRDENGKFS